MTEFISRKYGNEGYEIIVKTDSNEHYRAIEDFARHLIDHSKPTTNADRIRAMSDEELAMQILKNPPIYDWPDSVRKIYFSYDRPSKDNPKQAWLDWLQQPAEGE